MGSLPKVVTTVPTGIVSSRLEMFVNRRVPEAALSGIVADPDVIASFLPSTITSWV